MNFNDFKRELSMSEQMLNDMTKELDSTPRTSPYFLVLLRSIESLQYSLHRARIMGDNNKGVSMKKQESNVSPLINHNKENTMFSTDVTVRRLQYMDYLMTNGDYDQEELIAMSLRELRAAVDTIQVRTITETYANANGTTSTRVTVRKAA